MNDNMEFRKAKREEAEEILQLYQSLIGTEYCVWTESYPTEREVDLTCREMHCFVCMRKCRNLMRENRGRGCRKGRQWDRCRLREDD